MFQLYTAHSSKFTLHKEFLHIFITLKVCGAELQKLNCSIYLTLPRMTITQHKILKQGRFGVITLSSQSSTLHEQLQCFLLRSEDSIERERERESVCVWGGRGGAQHLWRWSSNATGTRKSTPITCLHYDDVMVLTISQCKYLISWTSVLPGESFSWSRNSPL
jgi:folate-binding Fe-S cluster repair protein YgfZ